MANAATFTFSGTTLQLNLTAANESVAIAAGASSCSFALTVGSVVTTTPLPKLSLAFTLAP